MSNNAEYAGIPALARTMLANPPHDDKTAVTGDGIDFTVDTKTKIITNVSGKREFAVGDHDSERLTFQMDRYIEGHDMLLSNIARIHSFNGDAPNIYDIDDMAADESNPNKVIFSWLLSSAAIVAAGPIRFALRFKCTDDAGNETYSWGTKINEDMSVFNTLENSETVVRENVDILEQWKNDIFGTGESAISDIHSAAESEKQQIAQKGAEIIESIPDDYDTLAADVSGLKSDLIDDSDHLNLIYDEKLINNIATFHTGYSLNKETGNLVENINRTIIDFPVKETKTYILRNPYPDKDYLWYLDANKNPISKYSTNIVTGDNEIEIVSGAKYLRMLLMSGYSTLLYDKELIDYEYDRKLIGFGLDNNVVLAENYGVSPTNTAEENSTAMQKLLNNCGTIMLLKPGTYKFGKILKVKSNTRLLFGSGVFIDLSETVNGFMVNESAYSNINIDANIYIDGLSIKVNGSNLGGAGIVGMNGLLNFFNVNNLVLENIKCADIPNDVFFVHLCRFYNVLIDNITAIGKKDAIHVNCGNFLTIRHGIFKTYDDPIALNAHDYPRCVPYYGLIENVLIEDCIDEADTSTTGFFCRMLGGAWADWKSGNNYRHSDTIVTENGIYRMIGSGTTEYTSTVKPTHTSGEVTESDGITWRFIQPHFDAIYSVGCRNITFRNILLKKNRENVFAFHYDNDSFSRSYYPNAVPFVQTNIVFDNITCIGDITNFIYGITPVDNIKLMNSTLYGKTFLLLNTLGISSIYMGTNIFMVGNYYTDKTEDNQNILSIGDGRIARVRMSGNYSKKALTHSTDERVTIVNNDLFG